MSAYDVVKALHIGAAMLAFGAPLAYPVLLPYLRRAHPRAMPAVHDAQHWLTRRLVGPATVLLVMFGAYLATKRDLWGEPWVIAGLAAVAVIGVLGGVVMGPGFERMAALSRADVERSDGDGGISWGAEYEATYRRVMAVEHLLGAVVLVAVFFMAAKP